MTESKLKLDCASSALLVIDVQERLAAAMPAPSMDRVARATATLLRGASVLGVPVVVTEQYPRGLGPTIPSVREAIPAGARVFEKSTFSCWGTPEVRAAIESAARRQIVVCGMESHVCVFQTVRDLCAEGWSVFVATDAVLSRTEENRAIGFGLMRAAGAALTSVEAVLFDLLGAAGTPSFKAISALVK